MLALLTPASALAITWSLTFQPPAGRAPLEPNPSSATSEEQEETREARLEQWQRHRTSLLVTIILSGLSLAGGATLLGIGVLNARATSETPVGTIVGGSLLTAVGVAGVIGGSVGLARHNRRRAEIGFSPTGLRLRF